MQPRDFGARREGAGRIVRVGDEHDSGALGDRGEDRVDVGGVVAVVDDDGLGTDATRGDLVDRETVADVDDLVAGAGIGARDQMQDLVRAGAVDDARRIEVVMRRQCLAQRGRAGVGITFQRPVGGIERGLRCGAGAERVFVRRQLDHRAAIVGRRATGRVRRDPQNPGLRRGCGHDVCHGRGT